MMLMSCDSNDDDVSPKFTTAEFRITSEVEKIFVRATCEGDGTEQEADLKTQIRMYHRAIDDSELQLLTESLWKSSSLSQNQTSNSPDISTGRLMTIQDGDVIGFELEVQEIDNGTTIDAEDIFTILLQYSSDDKCWVNSQGQCFSTDEAGDYQFDILNTYTLEEGARCSIDFTFRVSAEMH